MVFFPLLKECNLNGEDTILNKPWLIENPPPPREDNDELNKTGRKEGIRDAIGVDITSERKTALAILTVKDGGLGFVLELNLCCVFLDACYTPATS